MENSGAFPLNGEEAVVGSVWDNAAALDSNASLMGALSAVRKTGKGAFREESIDLSSTRRELTSTAVENEALSNSTSEATLDSTRFVSSSTSEATLDSTHFFRPGVLGPIAATRLAQDRGNSSAVDRDALTGVAGSDQFVGGNIKFNFQSAGATVPLGYTADTGAAYDATRGYGWVRQDSLSTTPVPLDISTNTRDRNKTGVDQRLDTLIHMQGNHITNLSGVKIPAAWEYALPTGKYSVTVSVGDCRYTDSTHRIRAEGVEVIRPFVCNSTHNYELGTTTVNVTDGKLTIDAIGGSNTKINYLEIAQVSEGEHPSATGSSPASREPAVTRSSAVSIDVDLPNLGQGVDATTLNSTNIQLYQTESNILVPGNINTSGGGDAIVYQANAPLSANTHYTFRINEGVRDESGASFLPFSTTFTTGTSTSASTTGINFSKLTVYGSDGMGASLSSLVIDPDGTQLYAAALDGVLRRWTIQSDGTLANLQTFSGLTGNDPARPRAIVGIAFDPTDANVLWVSHNDTVFQQPANDFTGKISKLTLENGSDNVSIEDYVIGLPRSAKDHLSNSLAFGPDGKLYLSQGGNSAMGAPDDAWYQRSEQLLSAAVLQIDPRRNLSQPFNVQTQDYGGQTGTYDPYASNAPVKLYATGIRNAYDLLWHSNGKLYVPTNGSAAGGNTPDDPRTTINEGLNNVETQNDYLFEVEQGGYYGHPNPERDEYILNGGNLTSGVDPAEVVAGDGHSGYPAGTRPDPNYQGFAYDFGRNRSPDGIIEYQSNTFGGALKNQLLVLEYSGGKDILALQPGANGDIASEGISQIVSGLQNPLDLTENTRNGNLYVAELVDETSGQGQISLLRPA